MLIYSQKATMNFLFYISFFARTKLIKVGRSTLANTSEIGFYAYTIHNTHVSVFNLFTGEERLKVFLSYKI